MECALLCAVTLKPGAGVPDIQQLTIDRGMFARLMDLRGLIGAGPRVADHTINSIPMIPLPSRGDIRLANP